MGLRGNISLRKALVVVSFLLVVQSRRIFASGLSIQSKFCGSDHISYLNGSSLDFLYINGRLVDKYLFCKALKSFHANHCFVADDDLNHLCGLDLSLEYRDRLGLIDCIKQYFSYYRTDELPLNPGRKFLHKLAREDSARHNFLENSQPNEEKDAQKSLVPPKNIAVAASGMLVLCCSFLCPCFRARRKQTTHTVLSKDLNSMDSVSSLEMSTAPEKIPGSPLRVPGSPLRVPASPLRVPASPLRVPPSPGRFTMSPKLDRIGSIHLNISQVVRATQNFSPSMMLGEGGFGTVYKAQLQGGQIVAIKRAKKEHFEALSTEFSSEVQLLAKIDHRNLVKLLGYLDKGNERLIITEYVPNGTLREHLDGMRGKILDFNQRLEISIDVAHALTYLHLYSEKQIIHRDVKSSNILLTESMRAKVADFGFARLGSMDSDKTHISTKVKGTVGYLDPEYMRTYQLTPKSDVYSFGIVLLEILTGRRPVELKKHADERVTLRWAFKKYDEGNVRMIVDPLMQEVVDEDILMKMFDLAFQCAAPTKSDRPDMKAVGEQLWAIRMDYLRSTRRG